MIALAADCMLFEMACGKAVPLSAANISVEVEGEHASLFDSEFVRHAANAVFHYFRHELGRKAVTVAEFASALEKVLSGFALQTSASAETAPATIVLESDLGRLAEETGKDSDLFFFPLLREELRRQLRQSPQVVRFRGLRGCVKRLIGARRWNGHCRRLEEQIVAYLRDCLSAEPRESEFALVVE
jgi:hypothetical protein